MFDTTKTLSCVPGTKVWGLVTFLFLMTTVHAQEDGSDDEPSPKPSSNVLGRLFGTSNKKPVDKAAEKSQEKAKPKVPATPTAGKAGRNGFMVPLKSFTRAFRGPSETEIVEEAIEESAPPRLVAPRIPREPFRNLPRSQERRDRATNDLQVEEFPATTEPLDTPVQTSPAPIIRGNQSEVGSGVSTTTKPASAPSNRFEAPKTVTKSTAPEVVIETNSTSRRTAMDLQDKESQSRSVESRPGKNGTTKSSPPKNLIEIGNSTPDEPLTQSRKPSPTAMQPTPDAMEPVAKNLGLVAVPREKEKLQVSEVSKMSRPASLPTIPEPLKPSPAPTASKVNHGVSSDIHREMALPGVRITVNGPSAILVDQEGDYEVVAKNEGTDALNGIMVRVSVPQHVTVGKVAAAEGVVQPDNDQDGNAIIWELEHIPAGGSKSVRLMLQTPKPEHFALGIEWTTLPQTAEIAIQVQQPQLTLALEGPSEVEFGKPQMYRIRVRNPGNADAKAVSVSLSAEPYGSNQSDIGDIAAGSERIVEVELTFQQSGALPVVASASSEQSKLNANSTIEVQVKQSELLANWFGPADFYQGSAADYELEITNAGTITAIGTTCKIKLPAGADVLSMPQGAIRTGDYIKWDIKKIDPQEKLSFPLRLVMSKLGVNNVAFSAECSSGLESKAEINTLVDSIADLHLSVVDPTAPAPVGQPVTYEIIIANRGKKAATDVSVIAQFSDGIEPIRVDGHTGRIVPGQAVFNSIPSIGPNEKLVLRVIAQATKAGVHRFRAEVKSLGSDTDLLEEESTRYLATGQRADRR